MTKEELEEKINTYHMYAWGTADFFLAKNDKFKNTSKHINFFTALLGIVAVTSLSLDPKYLGELKLLVSFLSTVVTILSLAYSIYRRPKGDKYEAAYNDNKRLANDWEMLLSKLNSNSIKQDYALLFQETNKREQDDLLLLDNREKDCANMRRRALRHFNRPCLYCKKVPDSIDNNDCSCCK